MTEDTLPLEAVWKATLSALEGQDASVTDGVLRAAAVHWFDEAMLAALCNARALRPRILADGSPTPMPPDLLFVALESLPFIEAYAADRCRLHAHVRSALLSQLAERDPAFLHGLSEAVAGHLADRDPLDFDELLEQVFHLLVADPYAGAELVEIVFGSADLARVAYLDRLMSYVEELRATGRLSPLLSDRSLLWSVWAAAVAGDYRRAARLAEQGLDELPADSEVANELTLQLAFASEREGDRSRAANLARELAEREPETTWEIHALLLLGELVEVVDEKLAHYRDALSRFVTERGSAARERFELDPTRWSLGGLERGDAGEVLADAEVALDDHDAGPTEINVTYEQEDGLVLIPPSSALAETWLRIGIAEGRAARIVVATYWLDLAKTAFRVLDDTEGFQRVYSAHQRLVERHGDLGLLQELMTVQEQMLVWAQAIGSPPLELQTLVDLANASVRLGRLSDARSRYEQAARVAEQLGPDARAAVAEDLARIAITERSFDDADRQLDAAAALYESVSLDDARRLDFVVGDRWLAVNDTARAKEAYERVLEWASAGDHPDDEAVARQALAQVAYASFDLIEAEGQLRAAAALGGRLDAMRELETLGELSTVLRLQQRDDEAEALDTTVDARAAEFSLAGLLAERLLERAHTAARRGDLSAAQIGYRQSLRRFEELGEESSVFDSLLGLSWAASEAGDDATAIDAAERAAGMATEAGRRDWEFAALQAVGTAFVGAGRADEAIEVLQEAHRLKPDDPGVIANVGWAYLRADRFTDSIKWSQRALDLEPSDLFPYRNLGHALLGLGRLDEAKAAYARAIAGRFADDHFHNTLTELDLLARRNPGLPGLDEVAAWFRSEQERLDAAAGRCRPRRQ